MCFDVLSFYVQHAHKLYSIRRRDVRFDLYKNCTSIATIAVAQIVPCTPLSIPRPTGATPPIFRSAPTSQVPTGTGPLRDRHNKGQGKVAQPASLPFRVPCMVHLNSCKHTVRGRLT